MPSGASSCGIDVSAKKLTTAKRNQTGGVEKREFENTDAGHRALLKWLGRGARVCVEATGVYHLPLALKLRASGIRVMVLNPRVAKDYAKVLSNRSKTDKVDAAALLDYVERMPFIHWEAPRESVLQVRELGRRITELVKTGVEEKNRLHAKKASQISRFVQADAKALVAQIEAHIKRVEAQALTLIKADADLLEQFKILKGIRGVGTRSALLLLTELAVLDPTMTLKEIVAYSGLDPRQYESGSSVDRPVRISKVGNARVRAILFMIALTAVRHDRGARSFFGQLVARGKNKMQAIVAVMRKLLHGIWIVLQRRIPFDSNALFAASLAATESHSVASATQPEAQQDHRNGRSEAKELREQLDPGALEATPSQPKRRSA
jgi:transposase